MHQTPLHSEHQALGARLVDFSGWEMPLSYESILAEHRAVRERVGVFDVSHMGEFRVHGAGAARFLDQVATNHVGAIEDGQALYSPMCYEHGGTVDDLIIYRRRADDYLMVVNASNIGKDWSWLARHAADHTGVQLDDLSATTALIAVQGPRAVELAHRGVGHAATELGYYRFTSARAWDHRVTIARLGYTGEDGFELMVDAGAAIPLWRNILEDGRDLGIQAAGLGARDTLRFEAGFCLYGHELTEDITPLEAGIGWTVKLDKPDFVGAEPLRAQKAAGVPRRLVALVVDGRRVPRQGAFVRADGEVIGEVTSGMFAPTLNRPAALALVRRGTAGLGTTVEIDLRGTLCQAEVAKKPFYQRPG